MTCFWRAFLSNLGSVVSRLFLPFFYPIMIPVSKFLNEKRYSTLGGKTDKLDEAVNRELNVTRS